MSLLKFLGQPASQIYGYYVSKMVKLKWSDVDYLSNLGLSCRNEIDSNTGYYLQLICNLWSANELWWHQQQHTHSNSPCSYVGLIASKSTVKGTLWVCCSYCNRSAVHAVVTAYPQSTVNGIPTWSSLCDTLSYETLVACQEESGCVLLVHSQIHVFEVEHVVKPTCVLPLSLQSTYKHFTSIGTFR